MTRSRKALLVLMGAGVGAAVGTYLVLRRNRDKIDRGARRARQVSDQAGRVANILDGVGRAVGPHPEQRGATLDSE